MTRRRAPVLASALALAAGPVLAQTPGAAAPSPASAATRAAFEALVPPSAQFETVAEGFAWAEGPVWRRDRAELLFSDVPRNTVHRWREGQPLAVHLRPSGFTGLAGAEPPGHELGSNGLALDRAGRLLLADHGNRRVARLDDSLGITVTVADRYEGRRFNSPNDLVVGPAGDLYFTDPPYGLRGQDRDPRKELPFSGVYRLAPTGALTLVTRELPRPNGIALSPDARTLYVSNSDPARPVWLAFPVAADGAVGAGRVLFDAAPLARAGARGNPDGLAVDQAGHLFATGPGGVLVLAPDGRHLGTIPTPTPASNAAFGGFDGRTLFVTAGARVLRVRLATAGAGF